MPSTPVTTSVIRASSVPPRSPTLPPRSGLAATTRHHVTRVDSHAMTPEVHQEYQEYGIPVYGKVVTGVHDSRATVCLINYTQFLFSITARRTVLIRLVSEIINSAVASLGGGGRTAPDDTI